MVKDTISSTALIDVVRASNRPMADDAEAAGGGAGGAPGLEESATAVTIGRPRLLQQITTEAASRLTSLGVELLDVRITRLNFVDKVLEDVYRRMISERQRIAERISSEAYRDAEKTRGEADAAAARTYAEAYAQDPDFYSFVKSLETLEASVADRSTTAVLSTQGELLRFLRDPGARPARNGEARPSNSHRVAGNGPRRAAGSEGRGRARTSLSAPTERRGRSRESSPGIVATGLRRGGEKRCDRSESRPSGR